MQSRFAKVPRVFYGKATYQVTARVVKSVSTAAVAHPLALMWVTIPGPLGQKYRFNVQKNAQLSVTRSGRIFSRIILQIIFIFANRFVRIKYSLGSNILCLNEGALLCRLACRRDTPMSLPWLAQSYPQSSTRNHRPQHCSYNVAL